MGHDLQLRSDEGLVEGDGGALLPGLADHHVHLAALAASETSIDISALPLAHLRTVTSSLDPAADLWMRVIGYDDERHGRLDRDVLDELGLPVPLRVQHRSGGLWVLNSLGLERLPPAASGAAECDATGRPTGRLWRADHLLQQAWETPSFSLGAVSARLAALGITHVADATPGVTCNPLLERAVETHAVVQQVAVMSEKPPKEGSGLQSGPVKLIVDEGALPPLDELSDRISAAHAQGRPVAVHCVARVSLALTLTALDEAGSLRGDRIEHCAVSDERLSAGLAARGITVITQPTLLARRGDDYLDRVEAEDRPHLWPYASLLRAGVSVAPSSDAPYGDPDPWKTIHAAVSRRTPSGRVVGPAERVRPATALRGMLTSLDQPGGAPRTVAAGQRADVVLLDRPVEKALTAPHAVTVRVTVARGSVVHGCEQVH